MDTLDNFSCLSLLSLSLSIHSPSRKFSTAAADCSRVFLRMGATNCLMSVWSRPWKAVFIRGRATSRAVREKGKKGREERIKG